MNAPETGSRKPGAGGAVDREGAYSALVTRPLVREDVEYLRAKLDPRVTLVVPPAFTEDALLEAGEGAEVLLGPWVSRRMLERHGARIRLIQVPWTGVDTLDFDLLREFGPRVANSHSNAFCVAEHAVALLLAVARAIPLHDRDLRLGRWRRPGAAESGFLPPVSLRGKTVAIMGYGAIGSAIASLLAPFGARLVALTENPAPEPPAPLAELHAPGARLELASRADAVVLALPLTRSSRHFVNGEFLARMKPGAFLVNVGRGDLADEEALYQALRAGAIAGAALDTWYQYPSAGHPEVLPSARFPFQELENVVLSPHRAGFVGGHMPHLDDAVENLNRIAAGLTPRNLVDLDRGY